MDYNRKNVHRISQNQVIVRRVQGYKNFIPITCMIN